MTNKNMKRCSNSLPIREMQTKTWYHNSPIRLDSIQRVITGGTWMWLHETSHKVLVILWIDMHFRGKCLSNFKMRLSLAYQFHFGDSNSCHKDLFVTWIRRNILCHDNIVYKVENCKQPKDLSVREWLDKLCFIHMMISLHFFKIMKCIYLALELSKIYSVCGKAKQNTLFLQPI